MSNLTPQSPLMQPVEWQGQAYFTSQYFHAQYLANSQFGGKYRRHSDFLRVIRSIPAYALYVTQGDIAELDWNRMKAEGKQVLLSFQPLFQAAGWNPLTLLNATTQLALANFLDDEESKKLSVATNTSAARQFAPKSSRALLPDEHAERVASAWLRMGKLFNVPEHIAQQEAVKQVEQTTGIHLHAFLLTAPAQSSIKPEDIMLEPKDLAKELGMQSGAMVNRALEHIGWQVKAISGGWEATPIGQGSSTTHAWTADHGAKSGYNLKWRRQAVIDAFKTHGILQPDAI